MVQGAGERLFLLIVRGRGIKETQLRVGPGEFPEPYPDEPNPDPPGALFQKQGFHRAVEVLILEPGADQR
jgi:hypothetical protein